MKLIEYLPNYYQKSNITKEIQRVIEEELDKDRLSLKDLEKQMFISTATWALEIYEKELGLPISTNLNMRERREMIIAKIRGRGTVTKQMLKDTAESFSGGDVEVIEHYNKNAFTIKFVGTIGMPSNMQAFTDMIDAIKPAHLAYKYEYRWTTCEMIISWDIKCEDLKEVTCEQLKSYVGGDI